MLPQRFDPLDRRVLLRRVDCATLRTAVGIRARLPLFPASGFADLRIERHEILLTYRSHAFTTEHHSHPHLDTKTTFRPMNRRARVFAKSVFVEAEHNHFSQASVRRGREQAITLRGKTWNKSWKQVVEQTWNRTSRNRVESGYQGAAKSLRSKDGLLFFSAHNPKVGGSNPPPATKPPGSYKLPR